ncbi:iron-sulfur cluster assembly scaffold protein [Patescibacteria group bacterium]|nr:iron-sulfur cluster assembly scaffold protein [Patescibacteria group bacterium]MBU4512467.1 iron-sulfur cluster assembly scaffold protein [Patescibacteria group bacterium]MCG2692595.1 iron-sulfur cluster assembly scaffold protein [Candidatus Parcubacteria bacterium]
MYSKKLLQYFKNPKNVGKIKNPDAIGEAGNPMCGDIMKMYLKINDNKIIDAKFETLGCGAAIAMSSRVTELIKGKTIQKAMKLKAQDVAEGFDLPKQKYHCSILGIEALQKAIENYEKKSG